MTATDPKPCADCKHPAFFHDAKGCHAGDDWGASCKCKTPAPTPSETARTLDREYWLNVVLKDVPVHFPGGGLPMVNLNLVLAALEAAALPVRASQGEPEPIVFPPDVDALDMLDLSAEITYALDRVAREEITANKAAELVIDYVKRTLADKDTDEGELDDEY
jgi:hypothetical protein